MYTLKIKCRITQKNSVKFLPAPAAFFGGVFSHTVERCSLTLERMVIISLFSVFPSRVVTKLLRFVRLFELNFN